MQKSIEIYLKWVTIEMYYNALQIISMLRTYVINNIMGSTYWTNTLELEIVNYYSL